MHVKNKASKKVEAKNIWILFHDMFGNMTILYWSSVIDWQTFISIVRLFYHRQKIQIPSESVHFEEYQTEPNLTASKQTFQFVSVTKFQEF